MKRQLILIFLILLLAEISFAQSAYHLSQFQQQFSMINPAYTGVDDYLDIKISYRKKWAGMENTPENSLITINSPINNKTSYNQAPIRTSNPNQKQWIEGQKARLKFHGVGGMINYFSQGAYRNFAIKANYAYHIPISNKVKVSMGTSMGVESYRINVTDLSVWDPDMDQLYQSLLTSGNNLNYFVLKMGGAIYSDKFHFGLSYSPLIEHQFGSGNETMLRESRLDLIAGTKISLKPKYTFAPQVWVKLSESNSLSATGILGMYFGKSIWTGIGYSSKQNILISFNIFIKEKFSMGYAFESKGLNESNLGRLTHEIVINFTLFNHLNSKPKLW